MATITKKISVYCMKKLTVNWKKQIISHLLKKRLKDYSKKANIPGFRKGQVPAGLIKKMYGTSLFTDEILRSVDRELRSFLENDKLDIFAQPLPLEMDMRQLDVNNPAEYTFQFEVGLKPEFPIPDWSKTHVTRYVVTITDQMIDEEIDRLRNRYGNMKDEETINTEENVINVTFQETDAEGNGKEGGIQKDNSLLVKYFNSAFRPGLMGHKTGA